MPRFFQPTNLEQALTALAEEGDWLIFAGGTDIYPNPELAKTLNDRQVLGLSQIDDLKGISKDTAGWWIGANVTWSDIISQDLPELFAGLKQAAKQIGGPQIQHVATVVGNICNASPAADGVPVLLSLDAEIEVQSVNGRRLLPLQSFITGRRQTMLGEGEIVTRLFIPAHDEEAVTTDFLKAGGRKYLVISPAMVAGRLNWDQKGQITDCAIAIGACSEVAVRQSAVEEMVKTLNVSDLSGFSSNLMNLQALSPISDARAEAQYRADLAKELAHRLITGWGRQYG